MHGHDWDRLFLRVDARAISSGSRVVVALGDKSNQLLEQLQGRQVAAFRPGEFIENVHVGCPGVIFIFVVGGKLSLFFFLIVFIFLFLLVLGWKFGFFDWSTEPYFSNF
jgi:hypothetical protein